MSDYTPFGKDRKYENRYSLRPTEDDDRFEALPSYRHCRNAWSVLQRIQDDGREYFAEDSGDLSSWRKYCDVLITFIMSELGARRSIKKQDLATVLREYIQEFEHSFARMHSMLYGVAYTDNDVSILEGFFVLQEWAFRDSMYAIISYWIDDKTEHVLHRTHIKMEINETGCKTTTTTYKSEVDEMKVPKKYKHAMKRL